MRTIAKVNIKGVIVSNDWLEVYEWFGIEAVSPNKVAEQIEAANGESLEVVINSGGGDVYAGSEIYTMLKEYTGGSVGKIVGLAASAASVAAMGVKVLQISPTAQIMIHNVSSMAWGDHRALQHEAEVLKNWNTSIANAYILKSGITQDELLEMMNEETWLNAQQAKEKGFVDEIMFDDQSAPKLVASYGGSQLLPMEVVAKVKNELLQARQTGQQQTTEQPIVTQTPKVSFSFYQKKLALIERKMKI